MNRFNKIFYSLMIAVFMGVFAFSPAFAGEEASLKDSSGVVAFYSEPHDEGVVKVGENKIKFNSLAFKDGKIVAKGDKVSFKTDGKKVAKGSMAKN